MTDNPSISARTIEALTAIATGLHDIADAVRETGQYDDRVPVFEDDEPTTTGRIHALGPHQSFALNLACIPLRDAFGTPYLVGSVFTRRDPRDIDVRLILPDDDPALSNPDRRRFLGHAITAYLAALTGLPIDFQFQSRTEAKAEEGNGLRSALGIHFAPTASKEVGPIDPA